MGLKPKDTLDDLAAGRPIGCPDGELPFLTGKTDSENFAVWERAYRTGLSWDARRVTTLLTLSAALLAGAGALVATSGDSKSLIAYRLRVGHPRCPPPV